MKGDFTNIRRWPEKHYSSVRTQQGRVALDTDWNDQVEIQNHLDRTAAIDMIGVAGIPKGDPGFQIATNADGSDLTISAGRCWVDGLLCELEQPTTYVTQPDLPTPPLTSGGDLALPDGTYVAYLDAWEEHVMDLDDPDLQEPALAGVDTTTRTKVIWQVKLLAVADAGGTGRCDTAFAEWTNLIAPPTGALRARAQASVAASGCSVESTGGYRSLENQLYRVEIHEPGDQAAATFKWSRENGSVVAGWTGLTANVLSVSSPGRDSVLGFAVGDWIELTDDDHERTATPGVLAKITKVDANALTVDTGSFDPPGTLDFADFPHNPKVRRWEADLPTATSAARPLRPNPVGDGYVDLEDGVQVKFEDGTYQAGDYWVMPARTIGGNVIWPVDPATQIPLPEPRLGVQHHFARLALLRKAGASLTVAGCARLFPPLTEITAADVSYDPGCDALQGADTVQQALDLLCQENNLAFHNQHLHGWGIVDGLQVVCGPDAGPSDGGGAAVHDTITVNNGYAIAGTGMDIIVDAKDTSGNPLPGDAVKVLDLIQTGKVLPTDPSTGKLQDGSVSLVLNGGALPGRYGVVPYDSNSQTWTSFLQNTFWLDVYQNTIVPIIDAFKDEFSGDPTATREHVITFLNVLAQLLNPNAGARVFISAKEDRILRDFYTRLRQILQSKTFCAMLDGAVTQFPDYPPIYTAAAAGGPEPSTIFSPAPASASGTKPMGKLRVDPAGQTGYVVWGDINIHVMDVRADVPTTGPNGQPVFPGTHEIFQSTIQFPAAGALVQDVALSADGKTLYALALINNNTDTVFASANVSDPRNVTWTSAVTTLCSTPLVSLVFAPTIGAYYAIGPGKGLYQINPDQLTPNQQPLVAFAACGQLSIGEVGQQSLAFATVGTAPNYTSVVRIDLRNPTAPLTTFPLPPQNSGAPSSGSDDLVVALDPAGGFQRLFVVIDGTGGHTSKQLLSYDANTGALASQPIPIRFIPSGTTPPSDTDSSIYRLAFEPSSRTVLIASTSANVIQTYNVAQGGVAVTPVVQPAQNSPIWLAVNSNAGYVWVLNAVSMTINNVPLRYFGGATAFIDLGALANYHTQFLKAFVDLFGQSAQYLKDAVCHQLLIDSPGQADRTIYLARIDVKDGQVFNICNFSRRKYVHSFPTVEYWLSIIPILPLIRKAIGDFCCTILQQKFFGYQPPAPNSRADLIDGSTAVRYESSARGVNLGTLWTTEVLGRLGSFKSVGSSLASAVARTPPSPVPAAGASRFEMQNQPVGNVSRVLTDRGVIVTGTVPATAADLVQTVVSPARLAPGAKAVLVTDASGRVVAVKPEPTTPSTSTDLQTALAQRDQQIQRLTSQLEQMKADQQSALTARDQQLATLTAQIADVHKQLGDLAPTKRRTSRPPKE